ncbi:MAG: hypothetical protein OEM62_01850 [Acidobacteriota bacterium]|nr:hypothetical protein [Acidobacteriota bacterium]
MHELSHFTPPVRYRQDVVQALRDLGVVPRVSTQPRLVYEFLRALMTLEIRERKARRRELERLLGPQHLDDYARQIGLLRAKYHLLRRPLEDWVEKSASGAPGFHSDA